MLSSFPDFLGPSHGTIKTSSLWHLLPQLGLGVDLRNKGILFAELTLISECTSEYFQNVSEAKALGQ